MKLLHDFFRLHLAGRYTAAVRGGAGLPQFSVTVPAPLVPPAADRAVAAPPEAVVAIRREPASFLKTPRHRRLGSRRG
ncbi:hypothetical protein [Rhodanobacter ginsengiterrae]|uniref:hypothetical protein n=1 Tax=Rhodanobacter ginsengiterrae TaxID=2008451 RepID=UPI003CEB11E3